MISDAWDRLQPFSHVSITQVDIAATGLAVADTLTVRLHRSGNVVTSPLDIMAEFSGASQLTDTWMASFTNRRIEFHPRDRTAAEPGLIWVLVSNTSSNRANSVRVTIYGRRFPVLPVVPSESEIIKQLQRLQRG